MTKALVALTDRRWFDHLRRLAGTASGLDPDRAIVRLDEVNFWQPKSPRAVRGLPPGGPFFLRLKQEVRAIAGFGFFATWHDLSVQDAWRVFAEKNGAPTLGAMAEQIRTFRGRDADLFGPGAKPLGCIVLRDVHFLPPSQWLSWREAQGWHPNIVVSKGYELEHAPGDQLAALLKVPAPGLYESVMEEFADRFALVDCDERRWREQLASCRDGQGAFRLRLLRAYEGRCALTGERTEPVLEAAHIQPYLGPRSNHVQNGLLLRADLHDLYDQGYLTLVPRAGRGDELVIEVSSAIREQWQNGKIYYELHGQAPRQQPPRQSERPSVEALRWHAEHVFRSS